MAEVALVSSLYVATVDLVTQLVKEQLVSWLSAV